ncbi:MAG: aminotransferase class V-fold PLP-dependent enzyme, partial [Coriobacteriia bacterium]|nr:aminotransferase class V-fold PLP-dependent enzyme [Coriobacteriia bacterium]
AKIAELEGAPSAGTLCTSSGQAALMFAVLNICSAGDSIVSTSAIYGGTLNLFSITLKRLGIECVYVDQNAPDDELDAAFGPNTKLVFAETLANPALLVLDIEKFAALAHRHGVPLIVDNTFATPIHCKPIQYGADIIIHSTSKYMDGHAVQVGGAIVDSGNFDWTNGNFADLTEPDPSYHGLIYTQTYGRLAYITKARMQLMRDFGAYPAAHSAFLLNLGLETLPVRMRQYCANAQRVAEFLEAQPLVQSVRYPGLPSDPSYGLAQKYLGGRASGVISFIIKGNLEKTGRSAKENAIIFMDALQLTSNQVHVADIRSCVLHPASETHRQLTDEQLVAAGIDPGMIRFSTGLEDIEDILHDIEIGFKAVRES